MDQTQASKLIVEMVVRDFRVALGPLSRSYLRDLDPATKEAVAQAIKNHVYQIVMEL